MSISSAGDVSDYLGTYDNLKGTPGGLKSSITPCLKRSRFLTSVPVVPLNLYIYKTLFKKMYRFKGIKVCKGKRFVLVRAC